MTWFKTYVVVMLLLILASLPACSPMPLKEGPNARLLPGIAEPRDRNDMDLTVHRPWIVGHAHCIHEALATDQPGEAALMALATATGNVLIGCANVPSDHDLREAEAHRPWCTAIAPAWSDYWLEHELRHCEGWDHPAYHTDETWQERDMP